MELGLRDCVDKNLLVQNWFRKVWNLQLVPPADVVYVFENHIKMMRRTFLKNLKGLKAMTRLYHSLLPTWRLTG